MVPVLPPEGFCPGSVVPVKNRDKMRFGTVTTSPICTRVTRRMCLGMCTPIRIPWSRPQGYVLCAFQTQALAFGFSNVNPSRLDRVSGRAVGTGLLVAFINCIFLHSRLIILISCGVVTVLTILICIKLNPKCGSKSASMHFVYAFCSGPSWLQ